MSSSPPVLFEALGDKLGLTDELTDIELVVVRVGVTLMLLVGEDTAPVTVTEAGVGVAVAAFCSTLSVKDCWSHSVSFPPSRSFSAL